jgi:hypothetical protein
MSDKPGWPADELMARLDAAVKECAVQRYWIEGFARAIARPGTPPGHVTAKAEEICQEIEARRAGKPAQ